MLDIHSPDYWTPRPGCPRLFLAPMEGLNDQPWRRAYAHVIGGFDETCCEFIRMPKTGHAKSLAKAYDPTDTLPIPMAAQIMGEDPDACAAISQEIALKRAHRIDLNCGCPSNTVVGGGAGSSLLKTPQLIYAIVRAMKKACDVPITVKMRAGFHDESLFEENLLAIQEAGASFITLHPRTKVQGYSGFAKWSLVATAKQIVKIPVVASGDVVDEEKAWQLYQETGCDGIMIGRGAFIDPWIFWRLRAKFNKTPFQLSPCDEYTQLETLLRTFLSHIPEMSARGQTGRIKQIVRFLQQSRPSLQSFLRALLVEDNPPDQLIEKLMFIWRNHAQDLSTSC